MIRQVYPDCPASNTHTKKNAKKVLFAITNNIYNQPSGQWESLVIYLS